MNDKTTVAAMFAFLLLGLSAGAETLILTRGKAAPESTYRVLDVSAKGVLESYSAASGIRAGQFPALVDDAAKLWVPIVKDDLASAESALAELVSVAASASAQVEEDAKTPEQLALESNYFAAVDALYVLAGDPAPTNSAVPAAADVKAKAKKVKDAKGASKKADDFLDLRNAQIELMELDLELRSYDPDWRAKAKRPKP